MDVKPRPRLPWKLIVFGSRLRNRIRYILNIPRVFRNWWAWPLPKLGFNVVLQLRNGLRFSVRGGTNDLAVLNEAAILNPYLGSGHIELRQDAVVMDIGANIGDFTVMAASLCPLGRACTRSNPLVGTFRRLRSTRPSTCYPTSKSSRSHSAIMKAKSGYLSREANRARISVVRPIRKPRGSPLYRN